MQFKTTVLIIGLLTMFLNMNGNTFANDSADITVTVNNEKQVITDTIQSVFVFPGDQILLETTGLVSDLEFQHDSKLSLFSQAPNQWKVKIDEEPDIHTLHVIQDDIDIQLNIIVQVSSRQISKYRLDGYKIGKYPQNRKIKNKYYQRPKGFIKVTRKNKDIYLSPHFKLEQFLCKQNALYPKFVVIEPSLLMKLEYLIGVLRDYGYECETLSVLSGYRTPYYNSSLGNVPYSAHLYGEAADIYLDENHDGLMDDLNRDGTIDYRDAKVLYRIVQEVESEEGNENLTGGLGLYGRTSAHSPFVHVDVRGYKARWGNYQPPSKQLKLVFDKK